MEINQVILVDEQDNATGVAEKMKAHREGLLHRAFSVFIFNEKGEMLLQQRAADKYHSGGLWTNACCSHPQPGENTLQAAQRRLGEEMGFNVPVEKIFDFVYKAEFDNGLSEYEFDHVFAGEFSGPVDFNTTEVMDAEYRSIAGIQDSLENQPQQYTAWFRLAFPRVVECWEQRYNNREHKD
ncbi:MAG: isopentenyl-diphosphate Delta-isomerase [Chitinophagaceae bacterium]